MNVTPLLLSTKKPRPLSLGFQYQPVCGAACDVESHLYSFSFEPYPGWTRSFAPQQEILEYLERCADKYGLRPHLRLGTAATTAAFDEREGTWTVDTSRGDRLAARRDQAGARIVVQHAPAAAGVSVARRAG